MRDPDFISWQEVFQQPEAFQMSNDLPAEEDRFIAEYNSALRDVEAKRKELQNSVQILDRIRARFRSRYPSVYADVSSHREDD